MVGLSESAAIIERVRPDDFFITEPAKVIDGGDPWDFGPSVVEHLDIDLIEQLRRGPVQGADDTAVALGLASLVHKELLAFGTSGGEKLDDDELSTTILGLNSVLRRLAVPFSLPFRNFTGWKSFWISQDFAYSWQARRGWLEETFEPLHARLIRLEEATFEALANSVSPRAETGWGVVDVEIAELRRRFGVASSPQDYRAVGTHCMGVLEALGRTVYDPARHLRDGETVPPPDKSKQRLGRFIEDAVPGQKNEEVRGLAVKAIELAHRVKHGTAPTRRDAGISADAVILVANILRRLEQTD